MAGIAEFSDVLRQAMADIEEHGFDSQARIERWVDELGKAAGNQGVVSAEQLKKRLGVIWAQEVEKGGLARAHGMPTWKINQLMPKLRTELDRKMMASASLIKLNRQEMIARTMRRFQGWATSVPIGGSEAIDKPEVREQMKKALKSLPFEERRVMIDQAAKFKAGLSNIVAVEGGAIGGIWRSNWKAPGYDYREDHKDRDGKFYLLRDSWAIEKGLIDVRGATYTDEITMPAEEVFCFPGESEVEYAYLVEKAYRRWYNGELTEIITDSGKTIRATPNHPILTTCGWKAIGLLKEGEEVIKIADELIESFKSDQNNRVTTIAEIFGTLQKIGFMDSASISRKDFHGDGSDGNVDIVFPAWFLSFGDISSRNKGRIKLIFTKSLLPAMRCHFKMALLGIFRASNSIMSGLRNCLSIFWRGGFIAKLLGFAYSSHMPASKDNPRLNGTAADAIFGSDRLDGLPIRMKLSKDKVRVIRQIEFSGHVYNLETKYHWYSVNAIITHNCQCRYKYVYNLRSVPHEFLTKKGMEAIGK